MLKKGTAIFRLYPLDLLTTVFTENSIRIVFGSTVLAILVCANVWGGLKS